LRRKYRSKQSSNGKQISETEQGFSSLALVFVTDKQHQGARVLQGVGHLPLLLRPHVAPRMDGFTTPLGESGDEQVRDSDRDPQDETRQGIASVVSAGGSRVGCHINLSLNWA